MRKQGDKKAIKNIVQRNLRSEKRRNIMLVISIALASFLICFSGLIATSLLEVQKNRFRIHECFRRKTVKAKRRNGI